MGDIMEKTPNLKLPTNNQEVIQSKRWLPYIVAILGTLLTIILWFILISGRYSDRFFAATFQIALPWIALIAGIAIALLCAIAIRLAQVTRERATSLSLMDHDFKKEIAERIKAEESKQKLEIALLQGQKLQAIGTLAGGIAHDFNNILYAIKGYVEMAREDVSADCLVYKNLGKVLDAAQRGQDLVARILAFGRRHQHHELKPMHVKSILESVLSLLRPAIPASVSINLIGISDDHIILGDQTQLHQVIVNIINNAVDAMDGEGTVTIHISRILANDDYLYQFPNIADVNYCKIDISDTGHGMDQTTLERIFEPFFTTKEVGKGTGLGLATVHAIIEEHQGEISVISQLGHGTTFTLLLPEYQSKPSDQETTNGNHSFSRR